MSFSRRRGSSDHPDIWPGFVDALSTVLLVFIFVLVGFVSSQVYLSGIIFDKDSTLSDMEAKLSRICSLLSAEKKMTSALSSENSDLLRKISELGESVAILQSMFEKKEDLLTHAQEEKVGLEQRIENLTNELRDVLAALAAERHSLEEQKKALEYIKKENIKLNELSKMNEYRSEFFDRMRRIVKGRNGIKVVGDRFVIQSELFFKTASDGLNDDGKRQVSELAKVVKEIGAKISRKVKWILRVDGHTDNRPISKGGRFQSNWELSAARAISVVKHMIKDGVQPEHLVAAGFGEHQPIYTGSSDNDLEKNRRIEFKLDER
jgi:chemotaxis protein MotB